MLKPGVAAGSFTAAKSLLEKSFAKYFSIPFNSDGHFSGGLRATRPRFVRDEGGGLGRTEFVGSSTSMFCSPSFARSIWFSSFSCAISFCNFNTIWRQNTTPASTVKRSCTNLYGSGASHPTSQIIDKHVATRIMGHRMSLRGRF